MGLLFFVVSPYVRRARVLTALYGIQREVLARRDIVIHVFARLPLEDRPAREPREVFSLAEKGS